MAGPDLQGLVNPLLIVWARKMSRLDIDTAAKRAGTTAERLKDWESGSQIPTLAQLRKLADAYKRSIGVFFLKEIPREGTSLPIDYRRFELSMQQFMSPKLAVSIREAHGKREEALDIFKELEDVPPPFDLRIARNASPEQAAQTIGVRLGISDETRRSWPNEHAALSGWRSAVERLGVIVIQVSGVSLNEMRGAAISFESLPIIFLNGSDSPLGRLFSLLHELTHLVRVESAICDGIEDAPRAERLQQVEVFCNHVAGALLVPRASLLQHPLVQGTDSNSTWADHELTSLRRVFWASREVVLRRLLLLGRTSQAHYREMRAAFEADYESMRKNKKDGFVPHPRMVVLGNGRLLTRLALDAYAASAITGSELSRFLGTKLDHLPKIAEIMHERTAV